jgi:hypothetical protein
MLSYNYSWILSNLWHSKWALTIERKSEDDSSCRFEKRETKGNESKEILMQDTDKTQSEKHDEKNKQNGLSKYKK